MTNNIENLTNLIDQNTTSCRIVSVLYRKKGKPGHGAGEISRQTVLLNVNRDNALRRDLATIKAKFSSLTDPVEIEAAQEIISSLEASLSGFNPNYTKHGYYDGHGNGNVQSSDVSGSVYVKGYVIKKEVLVKGEYKEVKSRAKTLAKKKLSKGFKSSRFREFIVTPDNLKSLSVNGRLLMLDLVGPFDLPVAVNQPVDGYTVQVNEQSPLTV